jgi:hypothetical protein
LTAAGGKKVNGEFVTVWGASVKVEGGAKVVGNPTFDCNPKVVSG